MNVLRMAQIAQRLGRFLLVIDWIRIAPQVRVKVDPVARQSPPIWIDWDRIGLFESQRSLIFGRIWLTKIEMNIEEQKQELEIFQENIYVFGKAKDLLLFQKKKLAINYFTYSGLHSGDEF